MQVLAHRIVIAAAPERVVELCWDVERWPAIFPPCEAASVIEQDGDRQLIEISARAGERRMTWRSRRELHAAAGVLTFEQLDPAPPLSHMDGAWRFFPVDRGTLVALEHRFAVADQQALAFMSRSTDENSRRELEALKRALEARPADDQRAEFEDALTIAAPPAAIFPLLRDAWRWPRLLPHCDEIAMRYDDGVDQEFVMRIAVDGVDEQIRTVRHCSEPYAISYFQPEPPPALARHRGEWLLQPVGDETTLIARHAIALSPAGVRRVWGRIDVDEARARAIAAISANSRATMAAIRAAVTTRGDTA